MKNQTLSERFEELRKKAAACADSPNMDKLNAAYWDGQRDAWDMAAGVAQVREEKLADEASEAANA